MSDPRYRSASSFAGPPDEKQREKLSAKLSRRLCACEPRSTILATANRAPYRDGGWTVRHRPSPADSHVNAYVRFKLALTKPADHQALHGRSLGPAAGYAGTPLEVPLTLLVTPRDGFVYCALAGGLETKLRHRTRRAPGKNPLIFWHGQHHVAHLLIEEEDEMVASLSFLFLVSVSETKLDWKLMPE